MFSKFFDLYHGYVVAVGANAGKTPIESGRTALKFWFVNLLLCLGAFWLHPLVGFYVLMFQLMCIGFVFIIEMEDYAEFKTADAWYEYIKTIRFANTKELAYKSGDVYKSVCLFPAIIFVVATVFSLASHFNDKIAISAYLTMPLFVLAVYVYYVTPLVWRALKKAVGALKWPKFRIRFNGLEAWLNKRYGEDKK